MQYLGNLLIAAVGVEPQNENIAMFAIEAAAMVMVALAVSTQLIADVVYTFLNPRIRYR